jgi:enamine deaminase RidA (YjgF/YER057c/UK114 family)
MRLPRRGRGWTRKFFALTALACAAAFLAWPAQKKKKPKSEEEETQTLQLPKELPPAVTADTQRLAFYVTPLSAKGLLSQQVRDALKALFHETHGPVFAIRAFVAGTGDARRVRDLVSEIFTDRKQPLPTLSLIQAGGLPLEGAQVVLEAVAAAKKDVNPYGLAFFSAPVFASDNPLDAPAPLAAKSLAALARSVAAAGLQPPDVLRVTCFLSSLDNLDATRRLVGAEYPRAALDYVQTQRLPQQAVGACEAVARLRSDPGAPLRFLDVPGAPRENGESQIALVGAPQVVLTGTQASFGYSDQDARLAFERLAKSLEQAGSSMREVAVTRYYPLSPGIAAQVRKLRPGFFDAAHPPAGDMLLFEGLPAMDAGFAIDAVAVRPI